MPSELRTYLDKFTLEEIVEALFEDVDDSVAFLGTIAPMFSERAFAIVKPKIERMVAEIEAYARQQNHECLAVQVAIVELETEPMTLEEMNIIKKSIFEHIYKGD